MNSMESSSIFGLFQPKLRLLELFSYGGIRKMKTTTTDSFWQGLSGVLTIALVVALIGVPSLSYSQIIEEIVVTAQKREQNIQDVGIAITAFSGDQMDALGMTNTTEIIQQVPGLDMVAWSPTLTTFNIRGVSQNNFTDNLEAPVAVYVDEAYVASMNGINAQMFDMQRVEVLRGPQGTLFGRNATGGVIQYITRKADDDETNGYVEASGSEFGTYSVEGAIGGAFSDMARYRFSARKEESDGYIESSDFPEGNPLPSGGGNLGGSDGYAIRAALQFDLNDSATLDLMYKYSKDNTYDLAISYCLSFQI